MPPCTIAVIGGLVMDLVTVTDRMPEWGETLIASSFTRCAGGKAANSAIAVYRGSRPKPSPLAHAHTPESTDSELEKDNPSNIQVRFPSSTTDSELDKDNIQVRLIGAVGNDDFGRFLTDRLQISGVDVSGVRTIDGQMTNVSVVIVDSEIGENMILQTAGACMALVPDDFLSLDSLAGGVRPDLLIANLEIPRETVEQMIDTASREGVDTLLNPSPAKYLLHPVYEKITHLILNETEAALLSGRYLEEITTEEGWASVTDDFLMLGVKNVVLTLGAKGAYFSTELGRGDFVEAEKDLNVVDVTGAGDTFLGTYAVEYVQQKRLGKWDIRYAVQRACKASARTICQLGPQEAIPWADEIDPLKPPTEEVTATTVTQHVEGIENIDSQGPHDG